jgi:hypothetical protein
MRDNLETKTLILNFPERWKVIFFVSVFEVERGMMFVYRRRKRSTDIWLRGICAGATAVDIRKRLVNWYEGMYGPRFWLHDHARWLWSEALSDKIHHSN